MMVNVTRRTANTYQAAMQACPFARVHEFMLPLQLANLQPKETLVDFPSGGGYLRPFIAKINAEIGYVPVENVAGYAEYNPEIIGGTWTNLPFTDGQVDVVFTLAAIHHMLDCRAEFYQECFRVLSNQGRFIIADVLAGSAPARFLDEFVGSYSSQGHRARFIDLKTDSAEIEVAGLFKVSDAYSQRFAWEFKDVDSLVTYCRNLFRIDLASDRQIEEGLRHYLGIHQVDHGFDLQWELAFIRANKLPA
ncbi:class I SAM-dependent methyltransferase [Undibacterium fentianense]|uniref:Methyltransferase domain-containing protein n=1 Tax=Undibacterium fentianense TaxID=2828728 RepID=A0A941E313_9BURK|nr:methyltransferase domain-containing protein [Undibacterium fentianense]MBR7800142.1 methyltransferase domain-containing protein [Undibacterium fentianense]